MNVHVAQGSPAEKAFRALAGLPGQIAPPEAIAPGIGPTPARDLKFHGGKTIANLTFKNFYVGSAQSWQPSDIQSIDQALAAAMSDQDLNNVMVQYFGGQPINSTALPSEILPGAPPSVVSQGDIENTVRNLYSTGKLAGPDLGSTVLNFLLPSGTVLNTDTTLTGQAAPQRAQARRRPAIPHDEDDSLNGLGGYHGSVHIPKPGGAQDTVYYAIGVYSEILSDGSTNGIPVFDQPWKNIVATFYHELNEARTDADVEDAIAAGNDPSATRFLGWTSRQGEECGDFPVAEANPLTLVFQEVPLTIGNGTVPVQFQYSNAVHGPEGPIAQPHAIIAHGHHRPPAGGIGPSAGIS